MLTRHEPTRPTSTPLIYRVSTCQEINYSKIITGPNLTLANCFLTILQIIALLYKENDAILQPERSRTKSSQV